MQSIIAVYDCHFKISSRIMDYKPDLRRNEVLIIISTLFTLPQFQRQVYLSHVKSDVIHLNKTNSLTTL